MKIVGIHDEYPFFLIKDISLQSVTENGIGKNVFSMRLNHRYIIGIKRVAQATIIILAKQVIKRTATFEELKNMK